jgi:L-lactate dehydrogenase
MQRENFKVGIIGCGKVGMTTAYALLLKGLPTELVLVDRKKEYVEGEDLDLEHGMPFMQKAIITGTENYEDLREADVVIFTAGAAQKPGESRLDLTAKNKAIVEEIIPKILQYAPSALIIMVTNPVDVLTFHANQVAQAISQAGTANVRPGQIFGSGTLLDTSRFRFHLSEMLNLHPRSIHAYILGEHGDSSFPTLHSATVGGQRLTTLPDFSMEMAESAYEQAKNAAYKIIEGKGATYYAIATVLTHIVEAIHHDNRSVLPLSTPINDYHGHSGVSLSVPCVISRQGIERTLVIDLSDEEKGKLAHSVDTIRQYQG